MTGIRRWETMIFIAVTGGQWIPKGNNKIALKRAIARKWAALTR